MAIEKKDTKPVTTTETKPAAPEAKAAAKPEAKPAAKPEAKAAAKPAAKPAAKKAAAKKPAAKKPASKAAAKKPAAKAAKPAAKKAKVITIDTICEKVAKLIKAKNAAAIDYTIAVDIEVWGWEDGYNRHMYIEVKDGKADVKPYDYDESSFKAYISFADAMDVVNGKLTVKDAFLSGKLNAIGNVGAAVKLATIF